VLAKLPASGIKVDGDESFYPFRFTDLFPEKYGNTRKLGRVFGLQLEFELEFM